MTRRTERVSALLQRQLAEILNTMELPSLTTVSTVKVSADLKQALVGITVLSKLAEASVLQSLKAQLPRIQRIINSKFSTKNIPRVSFVLDDSEQYAARINELIKKTYDDV